MLSLNLLARRTATMASRRMILPAAVAKPSAVATLSTQTESQVHVVEDLLMNHRWAYLKDNMEEIHHLLTEPKTNHALREPSAILEDHIANSMQEIQYMLTADPCPNRGEVEARVCGLKRMLKTELYA